MTVNVYLESTRFTNGKVIGISLDSITNNLYVLKSSTLPILKSANVQCEALFLSASELLYLSHFFLLCEDRSTFSLLAYLHFACAGFPIRFTPSLTSVIFHPCVRLYACLLPAQPGILHCLIPIGLECLQHRTHNLSFLSQSWQGR